MPGHDVSYNSGGSASQPSHAVGMEMSESQETSLHYDHWSYGYSIEVPASPSSSDATDAYGSAPLPMGLTETNTEPQMRPSQEVIDRLDMVRS